MFYPDICETKTKTECYESGAVKVVVHMINRDGTLEGLEEENFAEEMHGMANHVKSLGQDISIAIEEMYICCCELEMG